MTKQVNKTAGNSDFIVLPVFDADQCLEIAATVKELSAYHVNRGNFWTLGAATYQDDVLAYPAIANAFNPIISAYFGKYFNYVKDALHIAFDTEIGMFAKDVGLPSFHIFNHEVGATKGHIHTDEPYERIDLSAFKWDAPFSFTIAVELPKNGGGIDFWWNHSGEELERLNALGSIPEPSYLPYQLGKMYLHSGKHPHRIANPEPHMGEGEWRITLQGHGITTDDSIAIYF